jgi:predicted Zn-dependent protease
MKHHSPLFKRLVAAMAIVLGLSVSTPNLVEAKSKAPVVEVIEVTKSGRKDPKPKISAKANTKLSKAFKLMEGEKYDEAIVLLDEILNAPKATPYEISKANQLKSNALYSTDRFLDAVAASQAAVKANGLSNKEHLEQMLVVAQLLMQEDKFDDAIAAFAAYEAEAPRMKGDDFALLASAYYNQDKFKEAITAIDKAFATGEPPKKPWNQIKVNSLYQGEDFAGAIAYLKELMAKEPNEKQWMNMLYSSYIGMDDYPSAIKALEDGKAKGLLTDETLWSQLYNLYISEERYNEAAASIEEGISKGVLKTDVKSLNALGQVYYTAAQDWDGKPEGKDMLKKAVEVYQRAIALNTNNGEPELWMAQIELFENDNSAAARDFAKKALSKELKSKGSAYYYLGVAEHQLENIPAARAALTEAAKFKETQTQAQSYMKNLR